MISRSHFVGSSLKRLLEILLTAVLVAFTSSSILFAQSTGEISGTVTDPSGAVVPGATVTLKNMGTNTVRTSVSGSAGIYTFTNVQPAQYNVSTTYAGFSTFSATVEIAVGGHVTLDAKLPVSNSTTTVEVSADQSIQVNTQTPEVSQVITSEEISQLPSLTRNPYDFVALSGNISAGDNTAAGGVQNGANRGVNFSLNGQRNSGTEILLDGVENISVFGDGVGITVPIDAVQEYRIITNNFSPEYGRASGGVVAVATKSGTNTFHGNAFEFNRLSATTANTVTNAQNGVAKGIYTRNQFGGNVNGPVLKDKLFFAAAAEFIRVRSAAPSISVVPTPELLAASAPNVQAFFSAYAGTTNYTVLSQSSNIQDSVSTDANGNPLPLVSTLPNGTPVFNTVSYTAPVNAGGGIPQNTYNIFGRLDYAIGQRTQAFFRYVDYNEIDQSGSVFSSPYPQYNVGGSTIGQAYLLSVAHEVNSSVSTLTKSSFSRVNTSNSYNTALQNTPTLIVSPNAQDPHSGKPFQFPGFYDTNPANGGLPFGGPQNTVQFNQDLNISKGRHNLQAGGQVLYIQMNNAYGAFAQANEQLGSSLKTGLPRFATGQLYHFQAAVNPAGATPCARNQFTGALMQTASCSIALPATQPSFARSDRYHDWAAYAQDQWKASTNLTINYGVRYEYFGVQHNDNPNLDSNFFYGPGNSLPAQIRSGALATTPNSPLGKLWNPQYGTVSPRIGFAYDLFGNGKTSFRAGYGISYERNFGNVTFNIIQNPPNYAVIVLGTNSSTVPVTNSNTGPISGGSGSVALPPTSLRHVDQNIRTAQTQFESATIDQQLGRGTVVEVTYNGARGIHLYDIKNYNIPGGGNLYLGDSLNGTDANGKPVQALSYVNPHFTNDNNRGSNGDSYYNAVNVQFTTRDIRHSGLSIVANYTFAHATDDLSTTFSETSAGNFSLGYTDPFNPALDHGNSDFDIRHRFVLAPLYRTPFFFKDKGGYLKQLFGGYEVTGIYSLRTGTPFTYYDSTNNNSGYSTPRYNPVTPVTAHTFKAIPVGAQNSGNLYQLTSGNGQNAGQALPANNPIANSFFAGVDPVNYPNGISDFGPYPSTMTARNSFRGPGAYNLDVSISKTIPIHERLNIELRAEGFDVTNHHNLYIQQAQDDAGQYPQPQIFASKGGVTGGANDERRFLQFAGKINF